MQLEVLHHTVDGAVHRVLLSGLPLGSRETAELLDVVRRIDGDDEARVVVLESSGADFCPGAAEELRPLDWTPDPAAALAGLRVPVVASLRGRVASVGFEIALAADIRYATPDLRCSLDDVAGGRLPCWGGTVRLPRAIGRPTATSVLLLGSELRDDDARRSGLVVDVVGPDELDATVTSAAEHLASLAPRALELTKEAIGRGAELPMRSALILEGDLNHLLQTTEDRSEGLRAFIDKRDAAFTGR